MRLLRSLAVAGATIALPGVAVAGDPLVDLDPLEDLPVPEPPSVQLAIGIDVRTLGGHELEFDRLRHLRRTVAYAPAPTGRAPEAGGDVVALGLRTTGDIAPHVYAGLDGSIGRVRLRDPGLEQAGAFFDEGRGRYYAMGGLAGLVAGGRWLVVRAELLVGIRGVDLPVRVEGNGSSRRLRVHAIQPIVEPRAAAEIWVSSRTTLGGHVGTDLLREGDLLVGGYLKLHWWD